MSRLQEIHNYLISIGKSEEDLRELDNFSVYLSMEIMEYAHRNQTRVNGEDYANHPTRCMNNYCKLVGIVPDGYFCADADLMYENGVPFDGVQEVCLLHDVIEDTDFTLEQLEEIFDECGQGNYFRQYIKTALEKITHDKSTDYLSYIKICMENPISAIAKMMDLQDNMNVLSLQDFDEQNFERTQNYLKYSYLINCKYRFIENARRYREAFAKAENN